MKKIALITNTKQWIIGINKDFGGGNVVASNIFRILKEKNYDITIICFGDKEEEKEGNVITKYIDNKIGSKEFSQKAKELSKDCDITINFMTQNILDGTIIQSHSYLYRTTRTNKLIQPFKRLLYKKKIDDQKNFILFQFNMLLLFQTVLKKIMKRI